jgi:hypothetical protein
MSNDSFPTGDRLDPRTHVRPLDHVVAARDGDTCVLVDLLSEKYYALNSTATYVWGLLHDGQSVDEVIASLTHTYDAPSDLCRADLTALIGALTTHGLVSVQ